MVESQAVGAPPAAAPNSKDGAGAPGLGPDGGNSSNKSSSNDQQRAHLAELLLAGGKAADALACADAALLSAPASPELLHLRGRCLLAAGNVPGGR